MMSCCTRRGQAASAESGQEPLENSVQTLLLALTLLCSTRMRPLPPAHDGQQKQSKTVPHFVGQDYLVAVSKQDAQTHFPAMVFVTTRSRLMSPPNVDASGRGLPRIRVSVKTRPDPPSNDATP